MCLKEPGRGSAPAQGVWCLACRVNVLVQLPADEKWEAEYTAQQEREAAEAAALAAAAGGAEAAKPAAKKGGKAGKRAAGKGAAGAEEAGGAAAEAAAEPAAAAAADDEKPAAGEGAAAPAEAEGEASGEAAAKAAAAREPPVFWRCCGCGHLEPARGHGGISGPLDIDEQAASIFSQAMVSSALFPGRSAGPPSSLGLARCHGRRRVATLAPSPAPWRPCWRGVGRSRRRHRSLHALGTSGPLSLLRTKPPEPALPRPAPLPPLPRPQMVLQMKAGAQALAQAESMLAFVRGGVNGRLHPYNVHSLDATEPLLSIQVGGKNY